MKKKLLLLLLLGITLTSNGQIRFISVDPGTETIKIKNFGASTVDISNYKLCIFPNYPQLNTLSVTSGSLNLASEAEVTIISSTNLVDTGGELGLYINTNSFGVSANIRDYVQWISTGGTRESVAVGAGIWSAGTSISNSAPTPYQYTGDGTTFEGVNDWDPTLNVEEFSLNNFSIFPNPGTNSLKFRFPNSLNKIKAEVYDILGKIIYTSNNITDSKVDITNWKSGLYIIRVSSLGQTISKRFVRQ